MQFIVDFVPVARVGVHADAVTAAGQQVGTVIQALAIIAARILIARNQIGGDIARHTARPIIVLNKMIQLHKVPHQFQRGIKSVEHILP